MRTITAFFVWLFISMPALATGISALSEEDTADGLKQALTQGASVAVDKLGVADGFLRIPKSRFLCPERYKKWKGLCALWAWASMPRG